MNLRIPGPTPLPPHVMAALQRPMIDHRGPEFAAIQKRIVAKLQEVYETKNDILLFTSSGTGALEASVANAISAGDHVLAFCAGSFGDRLADIAKGYGAALTRVNFEWGQAIDPDRVSAALRENPKTRAVLVTHNETSTGVLHPLKEIAASVRAHSDAVLIVDAVSSLAAVRVETDGWGIDLMGTASQKAWMCPPGVSMVSVSSRAWQANAASKSPRLYFDFVETKKWMEKGQTPFTPAVSVYFALDAALNLMETEGIANVYARHLRVAQRTRDQALKLGFSLFGDPHFVSPTVTALNVPQGIDSETLLRIAREEHGLVIGGGQAKLKGKIIRIGHLGYVHEEDIDSAMQVLEQVLKKMRG